MNRLLWLFTLTVLAGLSLPWLGQKGMFLDGIIYAGISHNMAVGQGSFWEPYYSEWVDRQFFSHPPLAFWLEAGLFRLCGSGFWVERLYSLLTFFAAAGLIALSWRRLVPERFSAFGWLPVLLWACIPQIIWAAPNNLLENTLAVWSLVAVYGLASFMHHRRLGWLLLGSAGVFAGLLTKGPVALAPFAFLPAWWLLHRKTYAFGHLVRDGLIAATALAAMCGVLLLYPPAANYARHYLDIQLIPSLTSEAQQASGSPVEEFVLLVVGELAVPLAALLLVAGRERVLRRPLLFPLSKPGIALILTSLAGIVPILLALKLRIFYIIPALPFFALGIAALLVPFVAGLVENAGKRSRQWVLSLVLVGVALTAGYAYRVWGTYNRDAVLLKDVEQVCRVVPAGDFATIPQQYVLEYSMLAYLVRFGQISATDRQALKWRFFPRATSPAEIRQAGYREVPVNLSLWRLGQR